MLQTDEQWLSIADEFYCAAVDHSRWYGALERLAAATGSRSGELITIGRDAVLPINIMTNIDPAIHRRGGRIPYRRSRDQSARQSGHDFARAQSDGRMRLPLARRARDESALQRVRSSLGYPVYLPGHARTTKRSADRPGRAALASAKATSTPSSAMSSRLLPRTCARPCRMQIALEGNGATLVRGALETLSIPAFVCGRTGAVQALTTPPKKSCAANTVFRFAIASCMHFGMTKTRR